ncbi:ParA family protein [Paraburkholderia strydomiana]|uniref:ParA family protein n=1 Tax=Paraburkholderia strydomiana TaxID=1245417 RepID=UPI0038BAD5CF
MKSLLIVSAKGGTGRTTLTCQFAHYLRLVCHQRVLVLDLAEPACCTHLLGRSGQAVVVGQGRTADVYRPDGAAADGSLHVLCAEVIHGLEPDEDPVRARYYANLRHLLSVTARRFDVCLIDCPTLPDQRAVCAAALCDAVLSPVVLTPECMDSVPELIHGPYGIRTFQTRLNPQLRFIGLFPMMVAPTLMQRTQARVLLATFSGWFIPDPHDPQGFLHLPDMEVIARAQGLGLSARQLVRADTGAREGWRVLRTCLDALASRLDWIEGSVALTTHGAGVCDV